MYKVFTQKLVVQDRAGREPDRVVTETVEISKETRRLADLLNKPVEVVREELVCGITLRTIGAYYTLVD